MNKKDFNKRLFLGITSRNGKGWQEKIKEINKYKIKEAAVFIEEISKSRCKDLFKELLDSSLKKIPLVHLRDDSTIDEIEFFRKNFKTKYFTIHESDFPIKPELKKYRKKLYLEMNFDDYISKKVNVKKIGGFCIDLSHFKAAENSFSKEFLYIIDKRKFKKLFKCNHVNGYSYKKNLDMHTIKSEKDFNYLKTVPKFLFGNVIAIECYNSIKEQIKFKKYLIKLLNKNFN